MKKWLLFCFFTHATFAACTIQDDAKQTVTLAQPAKRIISLAPDITEILFTIGAGSSVIGVIGGTDYPNDAKHLPLVGSYAGLDMEKIAALHPDLIVTWGGLFRHQLTFFKKSGVAVYVSNPHRLNDVAITMKHLGCLTDNREKAALESAYYLELIRSLREQYAIQKPIKVFYQIGSYALMTINKDSWIHEAITACGGKNVFAEAKFIAPEISMESVIAANPDVILSDQQNPAWLKRFQRWPMLSAVKHGHLYAIHPDWVERAGPRLPLGVADICQKLQLAREKDQKRDS